MLIDAVREGSWLTSTHEFPHLTPGTPVMVHRDHVGLFIYCSSGTVYLKDHSDGDRYRGFMEYQTPFDVRICPGCGEGFTTPFRLKRRPSSVCSRKCRKRMLRRRNDPS